MEIKDKILKYVSFMLVLLAPLVFWSHRLFPHISSKTFFIYGLIEILLFTWIYSAIVDKSYRISKNVLLFSIPVFGFIIWMTIAGLLGVNPVLSFWSSFGRGTGLLTLYHSLALMFVIASLVKKYGFSYILSLFQYFIAGSFILAVSVWLGTEGFHLPARVLETDAGGGLAGNSTLTAGYFLFTLMMAVFLLSVKSINVKMKWFIGLTIATIIFSPVFINIYGFLHDRSILGIARGTILALITGAGASWLGYMFLSSKKLFRGISVALTGIAIVVFAILWIQLLTPNTSLHNRFATEARETRFIFWDIAGKAMAEHPLIGYGPENYYSAFSAHFNPQVLVVENSFEGWVDRAHNIYYDLGSTGGYPSILFYALFLLSILYSTYKLYTKGLVSRNQASFIAGLVVAYVVNNLFTFDSTLSYMSLFILAGIVYGLDKNDSSQKSQPLKRIDQSDRNMIALGLSVLFVASFVFFVYMPSHQSRLYAEAFASAINNRPALYPALLEGPAIGSQWDISDLAFDSYKKYSSNLVALKNDKVKLPYLIKDLEGLLAHLYKVSEINKTNYQLYITMVSLENILTYMSDRPYTDENRDRVLGVLEKAKALSPTNPSVYWNMAQTKVWGGDFKGAEEAYRNAILVAPRLPSSYTLFLQYANILGDKKLFEEVMIEAKNNIPNYVFNK